MTWFLSTRLGRWLALIGAGLAALAGAVLYGWRKRGQAEAGRVLEGYQRTRKRMDEAHIPDDEHGVDAWLRARAKRGRDL